MLKIWKMLLLKIKGKLCDTFKGVCKRTNIAVYIEYNDEVHKLKNEIRIVK